MAVYESLTILESAMKLVSNPKGHSARIYNDGCRSSSLWFVIMFQATKNKTFPDVVGSKAVL